MSRRPAHRRRRLLVAVPALAAGLLAGCGDDDGGDDGPPGPPPSGSVMATAEPLDETGGPGDTVLNNQPTSPAANNAPPDSTGTG